MENSENRKEGMSAEGAEVFEPVGDVLNQYFEELENGSDISSLEDEKDNGPKEYIGDTGSSRDHGNSYSKNDHQNIAEEKQTSADNKSSAATVSDTRTVKEASGAPDSQGLVIKKNKWVYILLAAVLSAIPVLLFLKLYERFPDSFYYWYPWKRYSSSSSTHHLFILELYNTYGVNAFLIVQFCASFALSLLFASTSKRTNLGSFVLICFIADFVVFIVNTIFYEICYFLCGVFPLIILFYGLGAVTFTGGSIVYIFGSVVDGIAEIISID